MEIKDLFDLIDKFDHSSLSEIRVKGADGSITLKKETLSTMHLGSAPPHMGHQTLHVAHTIPTAGSENAATAGEPGVETVPSPIVGTFYRSPSPDSPAFVETGSQVKSGTTIAIIEAMKVMNQLEADFDMEIVSVLVENGQMVEYGSPLFEVKRI